ncbi:MAG TPA: hypothetical protein DHV28_13150 [Ignavibacteriales bacterium]|nr:hypothetical protein [Ignavibacteriales bacterium]
MIFPKLFLNPFFTPIQIQGQLDFSIKIEEKTKIEVIIEKFISNINKKQLNRYESKVCPCHILSVNFNLTKSA